MIPETAMFHFDFNVTGAERKRLVQAIADYVQVDAEYLGAPSFAYRVDYFTIDKDGCVSFDSRADSEEINTLIEALVQQGFVSAVSDRNLPKNEAAAEAETGEQDAPALTAENPENSSKMNPNIEEDGLNVVLVLPIDAVSPEKLNKLLQAKGKLIKKALALDELPLDIREDTIAFPWFPDHPDHNTMKARIHLITAMCKMSKQQKRIIAKERAVENEKFAMRTFLLRLGFIGPEYKVDRKILLKNLSGNGSYRSGRHGSQETPNTAQDKPTAH